MDYSYLDMLRHLENGREIEFVYSGHYYAIINGSRKWFFYMDQQITEICEFEEKRQLIEKVGSIILQNETLESVINKKRYDEGTLYIL
ncbi:hypothetical protein [Anaerotignum propionicum]|uniref:Uncharacterized protein n=1 Tax=Anaerotignum propionicum DSM 1682 TaxID=991789 RepID=A0A0X1U806_ANAPI|nr:hypothetical protein [Anaerotignum propionicum]AMJ41065.1 hypothetical protein CPRO_14720 [Anaerotignum propionicum DSM 1682]SHE62631.1 hypothetical protein SAMN02745151_01283 [[Clostridium] propionicum DSM 1682] [Anaerotignum propionicum DSM 1682]